MSWLDDTKINPSGLGERRWRLKEVNEEVRAGITRKSRVGGDGDDNNRRQNQE